MIRHHHETVEAVSFLIKIQERISDQSIVSGMFKHTGAGSLIQPELNFRCEPLVIVKFLIQGMRIGVLREPLITFMSPDA